jgi:hypothetical protein
VTSNGFEAAQDEEELLFPTGHVAEQIAYFAIDSPTGQGTISINGEAVTFELQQLTVNHNWTAIFGIEVRLQEEQSKDSELAHFNESLDVMKLGEQLYAQSVTNNGIDPFTIRMR